MTECQIKLREAGKPYSLACAKCGFGTCKEEQDYASLTARIRELDALQSLAAVDREFAKKTANDLVMWKARAERAEAQIAAPAVKVKPLVWEVDHHGRRNHPEATRAECPIFGQVCADRPTDQAEVEARRAARILSAIEAAPAAAVRDAALEEAARMVETTAYTSSGDTRALEPVSAGLVGMDMHHATIAAAIRALKGGAK